MPLVLIMVVDRNLPHRFRALFLTCLVSWGLAEVIPNFSSSRWEQTIPTNLKCHRVPEPHHDKKIFIVSLIEFQVILGRGCPFNVV